MRYMTPLMLILTLLSSCGDKKTKVFIPEGSILLGKKVGASNKHMKLNFRYIWHKEGALKTRVCPNQVKSKFNWDDYRITGFIKEFSCGASHPVDAVLVDKEGNEGITPSDESTLIFKTSRSFYLSSKEVEQHLIQGSGINLNKLIEKYEAEND